MTITRVLLAIASFSFALVTGFRTGANLNPIEKLMRRSMQIDTTPGVPVPKNDQFNLLLIGVDNVQSKDAKLQSIWIMALPKNTSRLNLIPIFPSVKNPVRNLILAEAFQLYKGQPSQEFWDVMKKTDTWWSAYVVRDKADLSKLIDVLGGISVNGEQLNGTQALSKIPNWKYNPQTAMEQQQIVFEGICNQISAKQTSGTTTGVFIQTMNFSKNTATFIGQWVAKISANKSLGCHFPTFVDFPVSPTIVGP
jgi:hypothetical protein